MTRADKALSLAVEQAKLSSRIKALTEELRGLTCPREDTDDPRDGHNCLSEAFQVERDEDWHQPRYLTDDEVREHIADCPVCPRVFEVIRERKALRARLARVRGAVTRVGLAALKEAS